MNRRFLMSFRAALLPGLFVLIALATLLTCLFYGYAAVILAPYPGIIFDPSWTIIEVPPCEAKPDWCQANQGQLAVGDRLLQIGDLTYAQSRADRRTVAFGGYRAGDVVMLSVQRGTQVLQIPWQMLGPTSSTLFERLSGFLVYAPFWLAGTGILFYLRPRDARWRQFIAFNYATALWLAIGLYSSLHVAYSSLFQHALSWLLVPIYWHLHLNIPNPIAPRLQRYLAPILYVSAIGLAALELVQLLPEQAYAVALILAIIGSLTPLSANFLAKRPVSDQIAPRLIFVGILVSLLPGIVLAILPRLLQVSVYATLAPNVAILAVPLLPFFYVYAIYKHRLGRLEPRANHLLSLYSFVLVFMTAFVAVHIISSQWFALPTEVLLFNLVVSTIAVIVALPLRSALQQVLERLAYGARPQASDIIRNFANRIPSALEPDALVQLLTRELLPELLVRQSALYLLDSSMVQRLYTEGVSDGGMVLASSPVSAPASVAGAAGLDRPLPKAADLPLPAGKIPARTNGTAQPRSLAARQAGLDRLDSAQAALPLPSHPASELSDAVQLLAAQAGRYRTPGTAVPQTFDWVRLAICLQAREKTIGIWLLGQRDPDDYYPHKDVVLLQALGNLIATALENIRLFAEARDATQQVEAMRQQLHAALEAAILEKSRYIAVIQAMGAAMVMTDHDQRIVVVNPMAEALLRQSQPELLGRLWNELFIIGDQARGTLPHWHLTGGTAHGENGLSIRGRFPLRTHPEVVLDILSTQYQAQGQPEGYVHVLYDVSAQEEFSRTKDDFLLNVAHELKGPLASWRISLDSLMEDYTAISARDMGVLLRTLQRTAVKLQSLVDTLLDVGRMQTGHFLVRPTRTRVTSMILDGLAQIEPLLKTRGQTIDLQLDCGAHCTVLADRQRIIQVLVNLLRNASKYGPEDQPIRLFSHREGGHVFVEVIDRGPGIAPEEQARLFQRFYRVKRVEDEGTGLGIGLALAKGIIDSHGGQIGVRSRPDEGATFWFSLPEVASSEP